MSKFSKLKDISLQLKVVVLTLAFCLFSTLVTFAVGYFISSDTISKLSQDNLLSNGKSIQEEISRYAKDSVEFTHVLAKNRLIEGMFLSYESSFYGAGLEPGKDQKVEGKGYLALHESYGGRANKFLQNYRFKNLYLSTLDKQIVYSVNSDPEGKILGRNLENGLLKDSKFSTCVSSALESDDSNKQFFTGYEYIKDLDETYSFICQKALAEFDHLSEGIKKGDTMGVIITQIDIDYINDITSSRQGLGETGHAYVVGPNKLLRSSYKNGDNSLSVNESLAQQKVLESDAITSSLNEKEGVSHIIDPSGNESFSFYSSLRFHDEKWGLIVEIHESEIYASIKQFIYTSLFSSLFLFMITAGTVFFIIKWLMRPVVSANELLTEISGGIGYSSKSFRGNADQLGKSSVRLTSTIDSTSSAVTELEASVQNNIKSVEISNKKADECLSAAEIGRKHTNQMKSAIDDIYQANQTFVQDVNNILEYLTQMSELINDIGSKTTVINDIVFQTKLLSFNASVEAARAGEHGKGFAVVAEEVANLASASGTAAGEISTMLEESIRRVESIVSDTKAKIENTTKANEEKINNGRDRVQDCDNALVEIYTNVQEVTNSITEIYESSKEQVNGLNSISTNVGEVGNVSHENNALSQEAQGSADHLFGFSTKLEQVVQNLEALIHGNSVSESKSNNPKLNKKQKDNKKANLTDKVKKDLAS